MNGRTFRESRVAIGICENAGKYENKDIRSRERPPVPCEPAVGRCRLLADPKVGPHRVPGRGQRVRQVVQTALRLQPLHRVPSHVRPCRKMLVGTFLFYKIFNSHLRKVKSLTLLYR